MSTFKAVTGMHDITPERSGHWARMEKVLHQTFNRYAYREIRMPIVEQTALFKRSIGEVTDIVEKEMYTFPDRNDKLLTLRPEGTAGCVRAAIENGLLNAPCKLWYQGPMFRYERPQKGRQRQFHQVGAEVFAYDSVEVEVEMLLLIQRIFQQFDVNDAVELQLNSIGSLDDRRNYRTALVSHLEKHKESLDADSQRRLSTNPMRILDSKNPDTQVLLDSAPVLMDFLSEASRSRFELLQQYLNEQGVAFTVNPRLVRGLDYYNDTVFEWVTNELGAQGTVCGGGRYDGLVEQLGGKPTPGVGFGLGLERLYLLLELRSFSGLSGDDFPDAYFLVADPAYQSRAFELAEQLRTAMPDFVIMQHLQPSSLKSQFKKADKSGAKWALIIGENEMTKHLLAVKNLQTGEQTELSVLEGIEKVVAELA